MIDNLQGPAAEIVEAADVLTTPSADSPVRHQYPALVLTSPSRPVFALSISSPSLCLSNIVSMVAERHLCLSALTCHGCCLQDFSADVEALKAFGYQTGSSALSPAGKALYDAYEGVTDYLFSS